MEYGLADDMEYQLVCRGSIYLTRSTCISRNRPACLYAVSQAGAMAGMRRLLGSVSLAIGSP